MPHQSLACIPRHRLAQTPTPITKMPFAWGGRDLFIKRDDLTGCALSGNKVRKLEYLIADAQRCGADTLLTCGGVQSNCARALAVAATMTGFRSVLILNGQQPAEFDGNYLLNQLVGADVELLPDASASMRNAVLNDRAMTLRRNGHTPYVVPFGGSSEVGVLGYVRAAFEIARQLGPAADRIDRVVMPVASGGTIAGLFIGFQLAGLRLRLTGAYVEEADAAWADVVTDLVARTAARFGFSIAAPIVGDEIEFLDARGAGYSQPTNDELRFIVSFARRTGLLVDPVYTGKALFAFDRAVRDDAIALRGDVLFLHTGGTFGLFPHSSALARAIGELDGADTVSTRGHVRPVRSAPVPTPAVAPPLPLSASQRISIASP